MMTISEDRLARDAGDWRNTTIAIEAFNKGLSQPQDVAIYLEDEPDATYGALAKEALRLIAALRDLGLSTGDVQFSISELARGRGCRYRCGGPRAGSEPHRANLS